MTKMPFYLEFRPFNLGEVIGQKNVVETLRQSSLNDSFSHAYLFSGNHGCGKTSMARILAALMTCENVKDAVACGKCRACTTIHNGVSLDVKEIDGATNRGIDDIKSIIESSHWAPQELRKKIIIIDEVHQLTKEANSALLKTIEEPPSSVAFILCTTEAKKILPTILSRCQRFNFTKVCLPEISQKLLYIAERKGINIDKDAIGVAAKISNGSVRDAIGYLEQISVAFPQRKIDGDIAERYFGATNKAGILNIIKSIINGEIPILLEQINDIIMAGADIKAILFDISESFRNMMLIKANVSEKVLNLPDFETKELTKIGENLKISQILKISHLFSEIDRKIEYNINDRWIMEATLINCALSLKKLS